MKHTHRIRLTLSLAVLALALGGTLPEAQGATPTTERVSVADDESPSNGDSFLPSVSADGRYVAFQSAASNLVSGDSNAVVDVFVRDRKLGTTERVSVDSNENQAIGGASQDPHISADGRYVVFESEATNLVSGDSNTARDAFLRDRTSGTTERVSISDGEAEATAVGAFSSDDPVVSDSGRYVAFSSSATNLVSGDSNTNADVFVRDRTNGTTERVSITSDEAQATGGSSGVPAMSADGNIVVFASSAIDLVSSDSNGNLDVFVRDRSAGTTARISTPADGSQATGGNSGTGGPAVSADGRYVVFDSDATNLVPSGGDTNGQTDIFRKDRTTGAIIRVNVKSDGTQASGDSAVATGPSISADGRFIAFESSATNLISGAEGLGNSDVYVHDALTRQTVRYSEGSEPNGLSQAPALAGKVPLGAFHSAATNLIGSDANGFQDVFLRAFRTLGGYFVLDDKGGIFTFGSATFRGSVPGLRAAGTPVGNANIVDLEVTPTGNGYYVLDDKGGIFTFGDAAFQGSVPGLRASGVSVGNAPILDMAVTPTGNGYLILDAAGGIFTFGDATFFGSIPQLRNQGVNVGSAAGVDLAITPTGLGYLILDDVGGIFSFGDAVFHGSVPGLRNSGVQIGSAPSIRLATMPTGNGYLVLDDVGGMFTFGDAQFFGSIPGLRNSGVQIGPAEGVDLALTPLGLGYLILDDVGGAFTFGDAEFLGSIPQLRNQGVQIGPNESIRLDPVATLTGG